MTTKTIAVPTFKVGDRVFVPATNSEWELGAGTITAFRTHLGSAPKEEYDEWANVTLDVPAKRHESDSPPRCDWTCRTSQLTDDRSAKSDRAVTPPYVITVGDDHAAIWWDGTHWTYNPAHARPYTDWHEAKAMMEELQNSRSSKHRTESMPVLKGDKPTIEDLEQMMDGPAPGIGILPNGELVAHPSRHLSAHIPRYKRPRP